MENTTQIVAGILFGKRNVKKNGLLKTQFEFLRLYVNSWGERNLTESQGTIEEHRKSVTKRSGVALFLCFGAAFA